MRRMNGIGSLIGILQAVFAVHAIKWDLSDAHDIGHNMDQGPVEKYTNRHRMILDKYHIRILSPSLAESCIREFSELVS